MSMSRSKNIIIFAVILSFVAVFSVFFGIENASAKSLDDWRPSCMVIQDLDKCHAKITENKTSINWLNEMISDYENNGNEYSEYIEMYQARFNYLHDYIYDQEVTIEELTKISYASYFAKTMLENVVGNDFAADNIFKWGFVNFILSLQDSGIVQLLDDYYDAKDTLDEAVSKEQQAENLYKNAKTDVEKLKTEIQNLQNNISYWEERLPLIYDIEHVKGAAGASNFAGDKFFNWPLANLSVVSPFGEQREVDENAPSTVKGEYYYHKGVDFDADEGTAVYAAADGFVSEAGENESMGNYIIIKHDDGYQTIYMHLSHIFVPNNVKVHRGDNIALSGNTGNSTGAHLHFQVQKNGNPIDPIDLLK